MYGRQPVHIEFNSLYTLADLKALRPEKMRGKAREDA